LSVLHRGPSTGNNCFKVVDELSGRVLHPRHRGVDTKSEVIPLFLWPTPRVTMEK
jgi:hypothetical protein